MAPPTVDRGSIDWADALGSNWVDINETVPDLIWPLSVQMYGRMRRDPRLTAILNGYTLPIRRATWRVDPAGCRDEVVQTTADDLGLPVLGTDVKPGPARRRGVSWSEHIRLALLSLTYGHAGFERRYEIRGQRARLVNLGERPPWTISAFNLNRDGTIKDVIQDAAGAKPIPASSLLWYVHEREGANWTGQSVLRSAYAPWLLKHELWRVNATSIRRFGMGVPNVEAPPGATPGQVLEAQRMASAMRVGDQSGAGLPNGFKFNLTGLTGSAPDAMEMIQYFDTQMSTMALAGFLDLGQTATGSRALGESFVDLFMLSLQAIADEIADAATSGQPGLTGIVTDLVNQNWGEDEPAPRIICTDVGENHELNVEAIGQLISSGALHADDDLEAYLRGTYRLPPRAIEDKVTGERSYAYDLDYGVLTIDERRAQINLPPLPNGAGNVLPTPANLRVAPPEEPATPPPAVVSATTRRRARSRAGVRAAGDPAADNRQLSVDEAASGVDPDGVQDEWQATLDTLIADWAAVAAAQQAELVAQVSAAVAGGDLVALAAMTVTTTVAADLLAGAMVGLAADSVTRMIGEAASQGVKIPAAKADDLWLIENATTIAQIMGTSTASAAGREALRVASPDRDGDQVAELVSEYLTGLSDAWLTDQLGGALTVAQNHGRFIAIDAAPSEPTLVASEVLDKNTCAKCVEIDGHEFETVEAANEAYATGGYIECLGRLRCRGIVVAIWKD